MAKLIRMSVPMIYPPTDSTRMFEWGVGITRELNAFFNAASQMLLDDRLLLLAFTQLVEAGFSVEPSGAIVELISESDVVSDVTAAIALGVPGQYLILVNAGTFNITLKENAQTHFIAGVDYVLLPKRVTLLKWDDVSTEWLQIA